MLRVVAHKSAAAARQYYAEGLKREDYYSQGQEVVGKWYGLASARLGLSGDVTPEAFAALVENQHPETGKQLTPRMKADRRVGYDLNFHAPKSLSLLHALTGDKRLVEAFRSAVAETMAEIETLAATRIRRGGAQNERLTGNLAWAEFVHFTSRPVSGIPDPHLHIHAFAFNATFDETENRWKAVSWAAIKKDAPYSQAVFHARLAEKISQLGFSIERTPAGWEVAGISRQLIEKFSRRGAKIEKLAKAKGITDPKVKDTLGALSREAKRHGLTQVNLMANWESRLSPEEKALIAQIGQGLAKSASRSAITAAMAFDDACEKLFAKNSVVQTNRLVAEALRFGVGHVTPECAWSEFYRRNMIVRQIEGEMLCTSVTVLAEEVAMINFVRSGRGMHAPIGERNFGFLNSPLSREQTRAVRHILNSRDQVIAIRGAAGVGKTTLMRAAVMEIEAAGFQVFAFAPSASASRETLREEGFIEAETVAHLLVNKKLQEKTRGQYIWIDEAGLVGIRDMSEILRIAGDSTRIILTGDAAQHSPVPRGDPFRLMQHYAGLRVVEVTEIHRQDRADYRKAVAALSEGDLRTGFRRLDEMGAILEVADDAERYRMLADDYLTLSRSGSVPLVVSPTHAEGKIATEAIREAKREAGLLGPEKSFVQYHDLRWEEPDRRRSDNYQQGLTVQFHQNAGGILRGSRFRIAGRDEQGNVVATDPNGKQFVLPLKDARHFQVFEEREINLARGDRVRITRGVKSDDGRRLNNGNVFTVKGFSRDGKIILNTGAVLDSEFGHLAHGYCQTSHSAQSKSVRHVLIAQSSESFSAGSIEQFYVSVSRAKESIRIYTDSREELQQAVGNSSIRLASLELAGFNRREMAGLMSTELNGQQWRDLIKSRRMEGVATEHVRNLLRERKQDSPQKSGQMNFQQYLAMRRGMAGPDGKSRSKGHPSAQTKKTATIEARGRSFLRPTELTETTKQKVAARKTQTKPAEQKQQPKSKTRLGRLTKGFENAKTRFKAVMARTKSAAQSIRHGRSSKQLPETKAGQLAKRRNNEPQKPPKPNSKTQQKVQQKAPAPAPRRVR